jgi:hypothetical protein
MSLYTSFEMTQSQIHARVCTTSRLIGGMLKLGRDDSSSFTLFSRTFPRTPKLHTRPILSSITPQNFNNLTFSLIGYVTQSPYANTIRAWSRSANLTSLSRRTAWDLRNSRTGVTNDEIFTEIACKAPDKNFRWADIRSTDAVVVNVGCVIKIVVTSIDQTVAVLYHRAHLTCLEKF